MSYLRGPDRSQVQLLPACVEDYVAADAPVCFIDAYVEGLDFAALGWYGIAPLGLNTCGAPAAARGIGRGCGLSVASRRAGPLRLVCDTAALRERGAAFTPLHRADVAACLHPPGTPHAEAA